MELAEAPFEEYSSCCDALLMKFCSICYEASSSICELPCCQEKAVCVKCLDQLLEESGDSILNCWSCGVSHQVQNLLSLRPTEDLLPLEDDKENVPTHQFSRFTSTLSSVTDKAQTEIEQLEVRTRSLQEAIVQLAKENEQLLEAVNNKENELFSLNEEIVTVRTNADEASQRAMVRAAEHDIDRRAWLDERQRLYAKIEESARCQMAIEQLKQQLVAKDAEIQNLKDKLMAARPAPAVGIDIGMSNLCVAYFEDNKVECVRNERNQSIIRSNIHFNAEAFSDQDPVQIGVEPNANVTSCLKRLLCSDYEAALALTEKQCLPLEVLTPLKYGGHYYDEALFRVATCPDEQFTSVELFTILLNKLKSNSDAHFAERRVLDAVIAIPANFVDHQRQAVLDAASIVGLNVLRLVNETSAIFYAFLQRSGEQVTGNTVMVISAGGGSTEATYFERQDQHGQFEIRNSKAMSFGGEDFDMLLAKHCLASWQQLMPDAKFDQDLLATLKEKCRKAKEDLSTGVKAIDVHLKLPNGTYFSLTVSRKEFDELISRHYLPRFGHLIDKVVAENAHPDEIVISGGSMRIPIVAQELQHLFPRARICKSVHFGEAVAHGTALIAASLSEKSDKLLCSNFMSMDLDFFLIDMEMDEIVHCWRIEASFPLPFAGKFTHTLPIKIAYHFDDFSSHFVIKVNVNKLPFGVADLGECKVDTFRFTLKVDNNGIIDDFNASVASNPGASFPVEKFHDGMPRKEARRISVKLNRYREEIESRSKQKQLCNNLDSLIAFAEGIDDLKDKCREWLKWFDGNSVVAVPEELNAKCLEIKQYLRSIGIEPPSVDN